MPYISEVPPIYVQRWYTGWITLRNQLVTPIRVMGRRVIQLFDALIGGNDFEISSKLTLRRRAGHTLYVTVGAPALAMYSWKSNTQGTIPIIDTNTDVEYINATPASVQITTKTGTNQSSILGIGNYLYVGNPLFNFKWDGPTGPQGKTNWGIIGPGTSSGPNTAGSGTSAAPGTTAWTNPGNVSSAVSFATCATGGSASQTLYAETFGFSITAGATIGGIQVTYDGSSTVNTGGGGHPQFSVQLVKGGITVGVPKFIFLTNVTTGFTSGGSNDTWGTTFTGTDVSQTNFGVAFSGSGLSNPTYSIRNVKITIFVGAAPTATPTGAGSFAAVNGFSYVYAYGNATSEEISNASPISVNTGPFSSKQYVGVGVTASTDPQVNQIRVYRTTDSGGGSQFFEIANSPFPNTTATIQDTTVDTALQVTSQAEINLGNTPPPTGLINLEYFAGRMWGSVNNVLFASTGPETISGKAPNSNWQPTFQWVIPQPILRNVRGPNGMVVFTVDDSYIVRGTDIVNYTVNEWVKDFGIRTQNAVDTDGTNMYVFTSDRQFIQVTAAGASDIGSAIADQLLNVDPTVASVKVNRFGLDAIARILDTVNNVAYDYNINQQAWALPTIFQMAACNALGSIETVPGVWRLLVSTTNSGTTSLAFRDLNNFQDLGTSYAPNAVVGSIEVADPGMLAKFGGRAGILLEAENAGTAPTISVLPNDKGITLSNPVGSQITGSFVSLINPLTFPTTLGAQPTAYRALLFFFLTGTNLSAYVRHFQLKISGIAENAATEILGFATVPDEKSESEGTSALPPIQGR